MDTDSASQPPTPAAAATTLATTMIAPPADSTSVAPSAFDDPYGAEDQQGKPSKTNNMDVQQYLNMSHYEQLMVMFQEHRNEDGSAGFDIDKFREVFSTVVGDNLTHDQMTMLFMKIDANSDGTVDWDEFTSYMVMGSLEDKETHSVFDDRVKRHFGSPHRDVIKRVEYIPKERKYISISREGTISLWSNSLRLQRLVHLHDPGAHGSLSTRKSAWISDATYLSDWNKMVTVTDDRQLCIWDILSIKPRQTAVISQLEHNPLSITHGHLDTDTSFLLWGDDGGYINHLTFTKKFLLESEHAPSSAFSSSEAVLTPTKLSKRDAQKRHGASMYRKKVHNDWCVSVKYFEELTCFVSCAGSESKSLCFGDLERKVWRSVSVNKGVKCFEFCRRPSFLVTGGRDKVIRLWNPYVLSKPAGSLTGHNACITCITVNHDEGHIISYSEDKVIKVWSARSLTQLQTFSSPISSSSILHSSFYPDETPLLVYDDHNNQLILGDIKLSIYPLYKSKSKRGGGGERSHHASVVAALYNEEFNQVVSCGTDGSVGVWDLERGERGFGYGNAHGSFELTAMCFDLSRRRLITGSRDAHLKMWNFNNGQPLRNLHKPSPTETTDIIYIEMGTNKYILSVGWDRRVVIWLDDPKDFDAHPIRIMESGHKGHQDDITSVAFCPPAMVCTASVDGTIVVWSLESGYIKHVLREPFLELRSKEEKSVEKVFFLPQTGMTVDGGGTGARKGCWVVSCHADGNVRVWDVGEGTMVYEMALGVTEEGLSTMELVNKGEGWILVVGGIRGHLKVLDVNMDIIHSSNDLTDLFKPAHAWRAHTQCITSVSYAKPHSTLLTSSKDGAIRVWTLSGTYIGTFGQSTPWHILAPSTYAPLPDDLRQASKLEEQRERIMQRHQESLKKSVIDTWRGLARDVDVAEDVQGESEETMKRLRVRALRAKVVKKMCEVYRKRMSAVDWTITPDLTSSSEDKPEFFRLKSSRPPSRLRTYPNVRYEAVYHLLDCHPLEDVPKPGARKTTSHSHRVEVGTPPLSAGTRRERRW
ncbi:WD40-repeat-containing domain protein [Gaertneriomyces semiglobifer]|nr:WD40-repeat-containing domain protein [Gaertneriomyces semiglobifer]